jgi:hypothetical protein
MSALHNTCEAACDGTSDFCPPRKGNETGSQLTKSQGVNVSPLRLRCNVTATYFGLIMDKKSVDAFSFSSYFSRNFQLTIKLDSKKYRVTV